MCFPVSGCAAFIHRVTDAFSFSRNTDIKTLIKKNFTICITVNLTIEWQTGKKGSGGRGDEGTEKRSGEGRREQKRKSKKSKCN